VNAQPIDPLPADAPAEALCSTDGDGEACTLVLRNTTAFDRELKWVDSRGEVHTYGRVPAGGSAIQNTYAGHVWRLVALPRAGDDRASPPADVHYTAPASSALIVLRAPDEPAAVSHSQSASTGSDAIDELGAARPRGKTRRGRRGARGRNGRARASSDPIASAPDAADPHPTAGDSLPGPTA